MIKDEIMNSIARQDSAHVPNSGGHLLIVDASPLSLLATAGALHSAGHQCTCARTHIAAIEALTTSAQDALVMDVGDDAAAALDFLQRARRITGCESMPAVLIAEARWAGLQQKTEALNIATRCLFKPIDPHSLLAVVNQLLWMPTLIQAHRAKGNRLTKDGWVTL
jgi:DNA-binding response OmpR family regulator